MLYKMTDKMEFYFTCILNQLIQTRVSIHMTHEAAYSEYATAPNALVTSCTVLMDTLLEII